MKKSSFFAFLRRLRFIRRWGLMRNTEVENNQEHSLDVAFIVHNLGLLHNLAGGQVDVNRLAVLAMYHDVSEIFTGDMPTPIKYFHPTLRSLYGEVERLAQEKLLHTLPEILQPYYKDIILGEMTDEEARLLKAADTMAAFMKCALERQAGNGEFNEAYEGILKKLHNMEMPAVEQFLDLYMDSMGQSLDVLNYSLEKKL
ncbi:5'-deoxynucleotidase [uncultured Veillonella sp.]|uniref:5'-deoxynucleotidase n=1 Tax=uncultured Veillonella sp. TaxID=159268 RepID=UPI00263679D6|nr:5'-deoxynucleotidase [uncultured Veillonella sp.]